MRIGDLTDLAGCRQVVDIQHAVWGHDAETVPASLLLASIKRGGILIGAADPEAPDRWAGFVWSMPGWREGAPTQWSHMLGVIPHARGRGLGEALKRAQRDRAIAQPVDLIEWTFDPLQAVNAHFNFAVLGCVATEYRVDAYGAMPGPLHRGTPTDRLVAQWWLRRPHVERRLAARTTPGTLTARSAELTNLPSAIALDDAAIPADVRLDLETRRLLVPVPADFTTLQQQAPDRALVWRLAVREVLTTYFRRGYRAVDFTGGFLLATG